jgi:Family of unknown function (DUF6131)
LRARWRGYQRDDFTYFLLGGSDMIILGVILALLGFLFAIPILWVIGLVLVAVGAILWVAGAVGNGVGGRRHYY